MSIDGPVPEIITQDKVKLWILTSEGIMQSIIHQVQFSARVVCEPKGILKCLTSLKREPYLRCSGVNK
jgi:hypothetical protein